jgi:light-regulated signal transduction histidine kinase (bacteriophytochrome)
MQAMELSYVSRVVGRVSMIGGLPRARRFWHTALVLPALCAVVALTYDTKAGAAGMRGAWLVAVNAVAIAAAMFALSRAEVRRRVAEATARERETQLTAERCRIDDQLEQRVRERTAELQAANEQLEAFSYSVAHDLRAPLRSISSFSEALCEDHGAQLAPEAVEHLGHIRRAAHRMGQMIDDLLSFSRASRGALRRERVDVSALARTIGARLRAAQPERQVDLIVQDGLVAQADPRLLDIVLTNLLGNAWKFTGKRLRARIEVAALAGTPTTLLVRDNGAGFEPSLAGRLFGVFQRLHAASEFDGTGIGLATAHRLVHRHGGLIWAEGQVEKGATIYFTLEPSAAA